MYLGNDNQGLVSSDGTLKIWDVNTYQEIRTLSDSDCDDVTCCVANAKHIISGSYDNIVRLWCFHKGELLSCFEGHGDTISSVTVIDDGSKALSGSDDGTFRVWNLGTSVHMKQDRSRGHSEEVSDIAVTRDGSRCVSASWDGTLKVWDCHAGKECFTLTGLKGVPQNVAIAADDRHFVTLSEDVNCLSIKVLNVPIPGRQMQFLAEKSKELSCFQSC
ncbi:WD-40 repeat [Paramuricea clavata]|uniref:WD-40 repeat n=1 Tax=Paramuricea clavata TaxID=317549 RepID=A0A6S7HGB6_PARCT|nr:WD-40 repeat [Paramuricea clavata]